MRKFDFKTKTALINFFNVFPLFDTYRDQIMETYDENMFLKAGYGNRPIFRVMFLEGKAINNTIFPISKPVDDATIISNIDYITDFSPNWAKFSNSYFNIISEDVKEAMLNSKHLKKFILTDKNFDDTVKTSNMYITENDLLEIISGNNFERMLKKCSVSYSHGGEEFISPRSWTYISDTPEKKLGQLDFVHVDEINGFGFIESIPSMNMNKRILGYLDDSELIKLCESNISKRNVNVDVLAKIPHKIFNQIDQDKLDSMVSVLVKVLSGNLRLKNPSVGVSGDLMGMLESLVAASILPNEDMVDIIKTVSTKQFIDFVTKYEDDYPELFYCMEINRLMQMSNR